MPRRLLQRLSDHVLGKTTSICQMGVLDVPTFITHVLMDVKCIDMSRDFKPTDRKGTLGFYWEDYCLFLAGFCGVFKEKGYEKNFLRSIEKLEYSRKLLYGSNAGKDYVEWALTKQEIL